ncbi:MAG: UDP-N-acetylglucosamine 1-carboxyvinyltransferase [Clostridia bacterium]|nr:UDP-N-acetylglucosamine 1-carboxyvinyltransferase [Clostridia bacterium]
MNKIVVRGGKPLSGSVEIGGSKNAALPLLFAGILTGEVCVFYALPRVSDVLITLEILRCLGARIRFAEGGAVTVDYTDIRPVLPSPTLTGAIRGSVYLLGAMLGRFGKAYLAGAGGCDFGLRPIDQHLAGFAALGAEEQTMDGVLTLSAEVLKSADITLKMPSVGATANLLMTATSAKGRTVIKNAAAEPHVGALCAFLTAAGAEIEGVDGDTLTVVGGKPLHGCSFTVIPDMIEAGTYLAAAMACGGRVTVKNTDPTHLGATLAAFDEMGATLLVGEREITLVAPDTYRGISLETGPYPALPTDLHPQLATLFAIGGRAVGEGTMNERVWQSRFRYTEELLKMGASLSVADTVLTVRPAPLHATTVRAPDLRGGVALLLAALATEGQSIITGAAVIGRGYEHLEAKLTALGADVRVIG